MILVLDVGVMAWLLLIAGAVVFGLVAQSVGEPTMPNGWLMDAIAFVGGAVVASEFVVAWQRIEPVYQGLAMGPAVIGGIVLALLVDAASRHLTGGSATRHAFRP